MIDIHLSKDKVTGADYRLAAIHLLALLRGKAASNVTMLLLTIVEISKILYADDVERTPRSILSFTTLLGSIKSFVVTPLNACTKFHVKNFLDYTYTL